MINTNEKIVEDVIVNNVLEEEINSASNENSNDNDLNQYVDIKEVEGIEYCQVKDKEAITLLGSALTWEGLNVDTNNIKDMFHWIENYSQLSHKRIYIILGKQMNQWYDLQYEYKYPDDLNIVAVALEDIVNVSALTLQRFQVGARWLDDIVANNLA